MVSFALAWQHLVILGIRLRRLGGSAETPESNKFWTYRLWPSQSDTRFVILVNEAERNASRIGFWCRYHSPE